MKINAAKIIAPFTRPVATFDSRSQSFADFLDSAAAQRGAAASQASSFGAKGLFGAPVSAGLSAADLFGLKMADEASDFEGPNMMEEPSSDVPAQPESAARADEEVGDALPPGGQDANADLDFHVGAMAADVEAEKQQPFRSQLSNAVEPESGAPGEDEPETQTAPETPGEPPAPEAQDQMLLTFGEGGVFDVHMTSLASDEIDQNELRRRTAKAVAEHGWRLGHLHFNGERLMATYKGEIDDHGD